MKDIFYRDNIDNSIKEDNMEIINDPSTGNSILVGGLTLENEPYALFVNGRLLDENGNGKDTEKEGKRISLIEPKYLQYNSIFTKEEKEIFDKTIRDNWSQIQNTYDWIFGKDKVTILKECPNYLELESEE
jgi:hypothetical protein